MAAGSQDYSTPEFHEQLHRRMHELPKLRQLMSEDSWQQLDQAQEQLDRVLPQLRRVEQVMETLERTRASLHDIQFMEPPDVCG